MMISYFILTRNLLVCVSKESPLPVVLPGNEHQRRMKRAFGGQPRDTPKPPQGGSRYPFEDYIGGHPIGVCMFKCNGAGKTAFYRMEYKPVRWRWLMPAPTVLYTMILDWLYAMGCPQHQTARCALADQVTAVLTGQSLRPSARMRALLSAATVPARQRYLRAARALGRP